MLIFLTAILVQLILIGGGNCDNSNKRLAKVKNMIKWIQSNGYVHGDIKPYSNGPFEVGMRGHVAEGDLVAIIPKKCWISVSTAKIDPKIGNAVRKSKLDYSDGENERAVIALFILYHSIVLKENSFHWPYIDSFPEPDHLPRSISHPEEIVELFHKFNSPCVNTILSDMSMVGDITSRVLKIIKSDEHLHRSFRDMRDLKEKIFWALNVITCRNFKGEKRLYLIPYLDMFDGNDENSPNNISFVEAKMSKSGASVVLKTQGEDPDGEVFLDYGGISSRSNCEVLSQFGFILENHSNDEFTIFVNNEERRMSYSKMVENPKLFETKFDVLEKSLEEKLGYFKRGDIDEYDDSKDYAIKFLKFEKRESEKCLRFIKNYEDYDEL